MPTASAAKKQEKIVNYVSLPDLPRARLIENQAAWAQRRKVEPGASSMQSRISYFVMGLSVAYLIQAVLKKRAGGAGESRVTDGKGSNVVDLKAWRRGMTT